MTTATRIHFFCAPVFLASRDYLRRLQSLRIAACGHRDGPDRSVRIGSIVLASGILSRLADCRLQSPMGWTDSSSSQTVGGTIALMLPYMGLTQVLIRHHCTGHRKPKTISTRWTGLTLPHARACPLARAWAAAGLWGRHLQDCSPGPGG